MSVVELKSVSKSWPAGEAGVRVLDCVDLSIERGALVALTGPLGGGKSTLFNLIGLLDVPDQGEVLIDNTPTSQLSEAARDALRSRTFGMIFESCDLVPVLNARDNVALPLWLHTLAANERDARAEQALAAVGLAPFATWMPARLSPVQRRRVAIARALVSGPRVLLAENPTANLEGADAWAVIELLRRLNEVHAATFVFSTTDARLLRHAHEVIELCDGHIVPPPPRAEVVPFARRAARPGTVDQGSRS